MQLARIVALVHPENNASIRVIEKLGMQLVDRINLWEIELLRFNVNKNEYVKELETVIDRYIQKSERTQEENTLRKQGEALR